MDSSSSRKNEIGFDDTNKLEVKVVHTLMRLQTKKKTPEVRGHSNAVTIQEIVDYLTNNCQYLDGDIESQVITALLSCVKNGTVCAQDNGKYRLIGANPRLMVSKCLTRSNHGSRCSCLTLLTKLTKVKPNNCCTLQIQGTSNPRRIIKTSMKRKSTSAGAGVAKSAKAKSKGKSKSKAKSNANAKAKSKTLRKSNEPKRSRCLQKIQTQLNTDIIKPLVVEGNSNNRKCNYCLRHHAKLVQMKACEKCYPLGVELGIPANAFSPREEVM